MMETRLHTQSKAAPPPSLTPVSGGVLQRKCACGGSAGFVNECDDCSNKKLSLQRSTHESEGPRCHDGVPAIVNEVLRSPGQALDSETRAFMEPRFGHRFGQVAVHPMNAPSDRLRIGPVADYYEQAADQMAGSVMRVPQPAAAAPAAFDFSQVRIHTDARAAESAESVGALAYTLGHEIVFGTGQYAPHTSAGQRLLAHELTHTIQQLGNSPANTARLQRTTGDGHDLQADRFAGDPELEACFDNEKLVQFGSRGEAVKKIQQALIDAGFPLPEFGVDGVFESETESAVRKFQRSHGLNPDGVVGPITMGELDEQFAGGAPAPAPTQPAPPSPSPEPMRTVKVWINAFIPQDVPDKSEPAPSPHTGKTMLRGPIPHVSDCYLTDNRDFSAAIHAPSRMHSEIEIDVTEPKENFQWHNCDPTHEIDCENGGAECTQQGDTSRMGFSSLDDSTRFIVVRLTAAADNPCQSGSPDIDYEGTIAINVAGRRVAFSGAIDQFPAFEMYATADGGAGVTMFRTMPEAGKDPWNLPGGANREQEGTASI